MSTMMHPQFLHPTVKPMTEACDECQVGPGRWFICSYHEGYHDALESVTTDDIEAVQP